jgi:hypothetical protein
LHTSGGARLQGLIEQRYGKVGQADIAGEAIALDLAERAKRFLKRNLRIGPVQQ